MTWKTTNTAKGDNKLYSDAKGVVPSLDLRFAEGKTLNDHITGQNLITFSRDSSGTYVDSEGVIQMAGHNLLTYSEEFDNVAWVKVPNSSILTVDDTTDPNGDQTADLISRTANQQIVYQLGPGAGTYVFSVYAKAGSSNLVTLASSTSFRGSAVTFNLSTGTPGSVVDYYNGSDATISLSSPVMTDAGNGWWRCQVNIVHTVARAIHVEPGDLTNTAASAYFWGAQLEKSAKVSPYLKTTTSTVAAPRFDHDPANNNASLGLLIEESRTNYIDNSTTLSFPFITPLGTGISPVVTTQTAVGPDGISASVTRCQFDRGTGNTSSDYSLVGFTPTTPSANYSESVWLKSNDNNDYVIIMYDIGGAKGDEFTVTPQWQRFTLDANTSYKNSSDAVTTTPDLLIGLRNDPSSPNFYTGNTNSQTADILVWGPQIENGTFVTSYVPTSGTAVTRAADVASITGTNFSSWYNQSAGTWFGEVKKAYATTQRLFEVGDSSTNQYSVSVRPGPTSTSFARQASSASFVNHSYPAKFAVADSVIDIQGCVNGALASLIFTGTSVTDNKLSIGGVMSTTGSNNTISRLTYFPERLPDATLQAITQ